MSTTITSKRYAQAIFQIAQENDELDKWLDELNTISLLMENKEFSSLVENPKLPFETKAKLVEKSLAGIGRMPLNLVYLLIAKDKTNLSSQIAVEYEQLLDEYHGIKKVDVITAIPYSKKVQGEFQRKIEELINSKVRVDFTVDENLLGGIIARIDGSVIDGSIRTRLNELKKNMASNRR
jgi:F-type H+-transporting ATPase subunit delta